MALSAGSSKAHSEATVSENTTNGPHYVTAATSLALKPQARESSSMLSQRKRQRVPSTSARPRNGCCPLLEQLPAELREQIWTFAVTDWNPLKAGNYGSDQDRGSNNSSASIISTTLLQKTPIRLDRFNRPLPPAITRTCKQIRHETLHLYYSENIFELWRPLFWLNDWTFSTLIDWLDGLGPRTRWLNDVVLMYKHETELEHDINAPLAELGLELGEGVISSRRELSDYEMSHEALGLPRHFGRKRRNRWVATAPSNG